MRYIWQHIFHLLADYNNSLPLHYYLKQYFRNHKQLGSRDRKGISDALYAWYRCGKAFSNDHHTREEQILAALFLCNINTKSFLKLWPDFIAENWHLTIPERIITLEANGYMLDISAICPSQIQLSGALQYLEWVYPILQQPKLFIRTRKKKDFIEKALQSVPYEWISETTIALPNGTDVAPLLPQDTYVVQDASSQATGNYFDLKNGQYWWDCCCGAGGKSLLLQDKGKEIHLLVSDIRSTILHNLKQRFTQYKLPLPEAIVADVSNPTLLSKQIGKRQFDCVLADVPCSGSGTWARTPEQLYFFDVENINEFAQRQAKILNNILPYVKQGGRIYYITCSLFRAENESVVDTVIDTSECKLLSQELINGLPIGADCMFIAVLEKC